MKTFKFLLTILFVFFSAEAYAATYQDDPYAFYPEGVTLDPSIPDPEEFLGFKFGHAPIRHHQLVEYMQLLARTSDRVVVNIVGYSHERRPLLEIIITSPENHARLDEIRTAHVALSDPTNNQAISDDMPVVTWLTYGVHGAEPSGMDASIPAAYYFAAAESPEMEAILKDSVIVIFAIHNPDGHSRRQAWQDLNLSKAVNRDLNDRVHGYDWPMGGRTNHYWFDLNRQWLLVQHPESQALIKTWHKWKPNISVDYHEMGWNQSYYFHPGIPDQRYPRIPQATVDIMTQWAKGPQGDLDAEQRLYYNEETFNAFYIGTGSAYPMVNGAVGMLYEASTGRGGEIEGDNGLRTTRDNIWKHFRTSISSVASANRLRAEFLSHQKDYFIEAARLGRADNIQGYVIASGGDEVRMWEFLKFLDRHQIKFNVLAQDVRTKGKAFNAGEAYVVPTNQPQYRMLKSLFEVETEFESTVFYDLSAWNMPMLFNLDYAEMTRVGGSQMGSDDLPAYPVLSAPNQASYAYVLDWRAYNAPKSLNRLHEAGVFTRVMTKPATIATTTGPVSLPRGAIMVSLFDQPLSEDEIFDLMTTIATIDGVPVHAATSAKTPEEGTDLGGESVLPVAPIKPLLITGDGINAYDAGEIWHLLDFRMGMPLTRVDMEYFKNGGQFGDLDLNAYTHLILPQGNYDFDEDMTAKIKDWVSAGGVLVGTRSGAKWVDENILKPEDEEAEEEADDEEEDK
ncbi:MAG: M14 family zinc carboxypeptidase, partial [Alphaproteobacteria bacterium]